MISSIPIIIMIILVSCNQRETTQSTKTDFSKDSIELARMIKSREDAMMNKNIDSAMSQFSLDITWINSQGYYFEGQKEVKKFHDYLANNDSLDYYYKAGKAKIRFIDTNNALAYYSWKMFWFRKDNPIDTVNREIGLMTLTANKIQNKWKWIAVTNQHTPWFYDEIEPVKIE